MPDTEKPKTYEENAKEQYEALGRFVEAFEATSSSFSRDSRV